MYLKITDKLAIGAEYYETRYSWGHKAFLYKITPPDQQDELIEREKITYYNRTWESYQFQTICQSLIDKALKNRLITKEEAEICQEYLKEDHINDKRLKTVATVAMLGDIFGSNQKEKNDWKARMLKAGLPEGALIMPEDWESLSENEKETRLNGAIAQLK